MTKLVCGAIEGVYQVEGDLRPEINLNIKRLMDLKLRGLRHRKACQFVDNEPDQCLNTQRTAQAGGQP